MNKVFKYFPRIVHVSSERCCIKAIIEYFVSIFFPCLLVCSSFAFGDMGPEYLNGRCLSEQSLFERSINVERWNGVTRVIPVFLSQIKYGKCRRESPTNVSRCLVAFSDSQNLNTARKCQVMLVERFKEVDNDSASCTARKEYNGIFNHLFHGPLIVFLLGFIYYHSRIRCFILQNALANRLAGSASAL